MKNIILVLAILGMACSCSQSSDVYNLPEEDNTETRAAQADICPLCGLSRCSYEHNELLREPTGAELQSTYNRFKSIFRSVRGSMAFLEQMASRIYFMEEADLDGPLQTVTSPYGTVNFIIKINPGFFTANNYTLVSQICLLHELYHIYSIEFHGGWSTDSAHWDMINSSSPYKDWIRSVFYGQTQDFYNKIIYTGLIEAYEFLSLRESERQAIEAFFVQHNIPRYDIYPFLF